MGRLSKIKRELIQEANKRLLNEHVPHPAGSCVHIQACEVGIGGGPGFYSTWFHSPVWGGSEDTGPLGGPVTQSDVGKVVVYETGGEEYQIYYQ